MEEKIDVQEKAFPLFRILYKNLLIIIMSIVLAALLGLGYSMLRVAPTYQASCSLILRTTIKMSDEENTVSREGALARKNLQTVKSLIKSPVVIKEINEAYENNNEVISKGAIDVICGETSLIFTITYTDRTPEIAEEKLNQVIKTFSSSRNLKDNIKADDVALVPTQNNYDITKNTFYGKYTVIGALAGAVISVLAVLLVYIMDNTIKTKEELEEIVGVDLLSCINKEKPLKS